MALRNVPFVTLVNAMYSTIACCLNVPERLDCLAGDAETSLGVKFKKGERKSKHVRDTKFNLELAYGWLATAKAPENEGGLGMTLRDAVAKLTAEWDQLPSEETLLRYWNNVKNQQERDFEIKPD